MIDITLERKDSSSFPGKGNATPTYRSISVNFPDGANLTLQECSAEGLSSLIDIYKRRKEAATSCSLWKATAEGNYGLVFLPAAGYRDGYIGNTDVGGAGSSGYY